MNEHNEIVKKVVWKDPNLNGIFITHVVKGEEDVVREQYAHLPHAECAPDLPIVEDDPEKLFVNAYVIKNKKVVVDLKKCKEIHTDYCRTERNKRLIELDQQQLIAIGKNDKKAIKEIEIKKQKLRDVPQLVLKNLKTCKTLKEVKRVMPPITRNV